MKPTGCVRCGGDGRHVLHPLELVGCDDCARAWIREETCSVEAIEAAVGAFTGSSLAAHWKRFDAELTRRTLAWAKRNNLEAA